MKELKLNEIMIIRNDFYKLIWIKGSNGTQNFYKYALKRLTNKELIDHLRDKKKYKKEQKEK
jgi:hypothetical protein